MVNGATEWPGLAEVALDAAAAGSAAVDDEGERLAVLRSYGVLDSDAEALFDDLTALAADLCETPMATITLVDHNRQWFKSRVGVRDCQTAREDSFCAHALHRQDPLVVPDARLDPRFRENPLVLGPPFIRFYAGAPLITADGFTLGTLCVMDHRPRDLSDRQQRHLTTLARQVMAQLNSRRQANRLAEEITTRRATEQRLADNDRLLRGVLSHPAAVIYAKDLDGRYILGNDSLYALFRAEPGTLMGRRDHDLVDHRAADGFRRVDQEIARTGEQRVLQETLPHPDGSVRHYMSTKFPLRHPDGTVYAVAGVSTDITAQVGAARAVEESERRWRQLFDESPVGIGLADADGVIVAANTALCTLYGRPHDVVVGSRAVDFSHPDDIATLGNVRDMLQAADSDVVQVEKRYVRPDGEVRWAWLTAARTPGPGGQTWTLAHAQDITERLEHERIVRDSEANLTAVAGVVQQIQAGGDARRTIVTACAELARARYVCLFESDPDEPSTLRVGASTAPELAGFRLTRNLPSPIWRAFEHGDWATGDGLGGRAPDRGPGGGVEVLVVPVRAGTEVLAVLTLGFDDGIPAAADKRGRVIALLADQAGVALRQSALMADLAARAVTDTLTGLPNRRGWDESVAAMIRDRHRSRRMVVALIDFDRFKLYNDTRGHAAGDDLLRTFAGRARSVLRGGDVLARWGGEEFALALPHCDDGDADRVLGRIAASMPDDQTCSIGYAELAPDEELAHAMIEADTALYIAKNNGRNQIRHF